MTPPSSDRILAAASGNGTSLPPVALGDIVAMLDGELRTAEIPDYPGAVNGLQVANGGKVHRVAVAVDASHAAIGEAVISGADLLIVHHGLFWGGAQPIVGVTYDKYRSLLANNVAVYASHLPLDLHAVHGNNVRLAESVGLTPDGGFARFKTVDIGVTGAADEPTDDLVRRVQGLVARYGGSVRTSVPAAGRRTRRWAICTGGGASSETLREAREKGVDTLIVGEGPHHTTVEAIEHNLCVVYAGHYATETLGVQALGALLESRFGLPWTFLHLPTGS
ncbi:MAG: Nif3-like dinuclear metal center hexameric protein [Gemmatimonadota bacterium]|jgi:dinuclear metal center YbgI/SA1388 family protein|nr:Nif3-like dinuclear metal center hexameric protein [Gemmatimonadota bacterium]MDQ8168055.1 Nif3-like dinuclear metal center hexameric protein [Gemmatimonadota bacterium]MDQ8171839.1 Nif3-like dinuclear metal center hexameric protein [Gemmatimonadota bacterium]